QVAQQVVGDGVAGNRAGEQAAEVGAAGVGEAGAVLAETVGGGHGEGAGVVVEGVVVAAQTHHVVAELESVAAGDLGEVFLEVEVLFDVEARVVDGRNTGDTGEAARADV